MSNNLYKVVNYLMAAYLHQLSAMCHQPEMNMDEIFQTADATAKIQ